MHAGSVSIPQGLPGRARRRAREAARELLRTDTACPGRGGPACGRRRQHCPGVSHSTSRHLLAGRAHLI